MQIEWIQGVDFRSYRTLSYSPAPRLNLLIGPNGHGKTNLLEAIALLTVGRSLRGARAADLLRWSAATASLSGEIRRGDATRRLRREVRPREDGALAVAGEGCPWARVIPFTWLDLAVLNGAPQARRNFLDGFAGKLAPAHLTTLARYRQVLARRNHLLQSGFDGPALAERLAPWDEQLISVGLELIARREAAVVAIAREMEHLYPALAACGDVRLEYRCSIGERTQEAFAREVGRRQREEVRRGQTLVGPHRDDLLIEVDGRDMRVSGSRGQQRLLALALRLAEARPVAAAVGSDPILLLDDALSELDPAAQRRVIEHVEDAGQVFLATAEEPGPVRHAAWWLVRDGQVEDLALAAGAA